MTRLILILLIALTAACNTVPHLSDAITEEQCLAWAGDAATDDQIDQCLDQAY